MFKSQIQVEDSGDKVKALQQIPADEFLGQAIDALISSDVAELTRLDRMVAMVTAPGDRAIFLYRRAVFAAILDSSARNLRLLHRATGRLGKDAHSHING